jgi:hypothetical protein
MPDEGVFMLDEVVFMPDWVVFIPGRLSGAMQGFAPRGYCDARCLFVASQ